MRNWVIFFLLVTLISCSEKKKNYKHLSLFNKNGYLQAVVEIPAGTNLKIEYNSKTNDFKPDQLEGTDRVIDFLPYPGNYGFIPSTYSDPEKGGDGDALDVLILGEHIPTGNVVSIIPIAIIKLLDNGEYDDKIIAIPASKKHQILKAKNYSTFSEKYPAAKKIIELWFQHYDPSNDLKIIEWKNEEEAVLEVEKWSVKSD